MGKFRNPGPFKKIGFSFRTRSEKAGDISLRVGHRFSFVHACVACKEPFIRYAAEMWIFSSYLQFIISILIHSGNQAAGNRAWMR